MPCRLLFFSLLHIHIPKPLPFELSWSKAPFYNALFLNLSLFISLSRIPISSLPLPPCVLFSGVSAGYRFRGLEL